MPGQERAGRAVEALGLIEVRGWSPGMVVLDVIDKAAEVELLQVELNDLYGACIKITGDSGNVQAAIAAGKLAAEQMHLECVTQIINAPSREARAAYDAKPEFSPLIEQDVIHFPRVRDRGDRSEHHVSEQAPFAIGMIETQGLTAVIEAIDTACKTANVEILGREKLGGGYITVLIKGDVAAVNAAIAAGREKVESSGLGKLIASHVIARPSSQILGLLPKA